MSKCANFSPVCMGKSFPLYVRLCIRFFLNLFPILIVPTPNANSKIFWRERIVRSENVKTNILSKDFQGFTYALHRLYKKYETKIRWLT